MNAELAPVPVGLVQAERDDAVPCRPQQQGGREGGVGVGCGGEGHDPPLQPGSGGGAGGRQRIAAFEQQLVGAGVRQAPGDVGVARDREGVGSGRSLAEPG
jgi:hypothetical protein